jgi:hypothetical protein
MFHPVACKNQKKFQLLNSLAIDSIANPHLNDDTGMIIVFPNETSGLAECIFRQKKESTKASTAYYGPLDGIFSPARRNERCVVTLHE